MREWISERPGAPAAQRPHNLRVWCDSLRNRIRGQCFSASIAFVFFWLSANWSDKLAHDGYHGYHGYQPVGCGGDGGVDLLIGKGNLSPQRRTRAKWLPWLPRIPSGLEIGELGKNNGYRLSLVPHLLRVRARLRTLLECRRWGDKCGFLYMGKCVPIDTGMEQEPILASRLIGAPPLGQMQSVSLHLHISSVTMFSWPTGRQL